MYSINKILAEEICYSFHLKFHRNFSVGKCERKVGEIMLKEETERYSQLKILPRYKSGKRQSRFASTTARKVVQIASVMHH